MDQVITFDKSLQQRLQEYNDVLAGYDSLSVCDIQKEWGYYLELTIDPAGWQAVWKIPRQTCEHLNIPFPSIVLVYVLGADFQELTALVKILAVQDDISLPDKHHVPLIQLWPTKGQDKSIVLNLQSTANSLDMVRFFYNHLFMPYDYDDDDEVDWKSQHLEQRLRLYYDMKNGVFPRVTGERLHSLFSEAKRLHFKQKQLEASLEDKSEDNSAENDDSEVEALMEVHLRMKDIKSEIEALENPLFRKIVIKKHQEASTALDDLTPRTWVVYDEGTAEDCIKFFSKVQTLYPNEVLKLAPRLGPILESTGPDNTFILSEKTHCIKTSGSLQQGGTLKGISSPEKTILASEVEDIMLDFSGNVLLENVTIQADSPQCAIIIRSGNLTLRNCRLIGDGVSLTHQGIIVLRGGSLNVIDCEIGKFYTAIVGNSGSSVSIENCQIYDCHIGIQIFDGSNLRINKAAIQNSKNYGICLETETGPNGEPPKTGDFDILNIVPNLQLEFVKGVDNVKGDAVINRKRQLTALEDLFDQESDLTVINGSDEEMAFDNTVVEKVQN